MITGTASRRPLLFPTRSRLTRFKRWVAGVLDLKMRGPHQPLYSKSRNREVARFMSLENDLAGTDLREIVNEIAHRAIALRQE